jgi:single-strand DNA-binding protein
MFNLVVLVGNIASDLDVRATQGGTYVGKFRLATSSYAGKAEDGTRKQATDFHNIVCFGKLAEFAGNHLKKGRAVIVNGRLKTSSWDDATTGTRKYMTEVVADDIQFAGGRPQEAEEGVAAA